MVAAAVTATTIAMTPGGATAGTASGGGSTNPSTDGPRAAHGVDTSSAIVRLSADPLATSPRAKPAPGKKIDFSSDAVKSQRAMLAGQRNDLKKWLQANAPGAKVVGEYDIALNAVSVRLNGVSLDTLRSAPNVVSASYEALYTPLAGGRSGGGGGTGGSGRRSVSDVDLPLINAGGDPQAGAGVKVAVIDTGIDVTHPCFAGGTINGLTNDKVIVAKVFNNKAVSRGYTAEAVQDHGTHVAGTIACDYETPAQVGDVTYPVSGVAPAAVLGSYNIFPGDVENARSEDILDALQAAYADGMDVANMSLGGGASGVQDLLTTAVDNFDQANMVVAVAAGNSGPGHYTVESPGSAARALSAGASTVGHFVGAPVTVGGTTYGAASGDFATVESDLNAPLGVVTSSGSLGLACTALPSGSLSGQIALVSRGSCTFSTKVKNAQDAGAVAVLVANNVAGDPVAMASDPTVQPAPTIPAYQVGQETGAKLLNENGASTTIGAQLTYLRTANDNIMAGFSSQGPTDVDYRVKPDVVAPGVNVLSSIPASFCDTPPCWAFFQGTSMATPHLAGMAAVLRGAHSEWSAEQIRSAVVNNATQGVLTDYKTGSSVVDDPNIVGAGLADLAAATKATIAIGPVSTSFGAVPTGSGQTRTATVALTDLTGSDQRPVAVSVANAPGSNVSFSVSTDKVALKAGASMTITVTMTSSKRAKAGDYSATLNVGNEHSVLYVFLK